MKLYEEFEYWVEEHLMMIKHPSYQVSISKDKGWDLMRMGLFETEWITYYEPEIVEQWNE